ncbi:cobalamin biosynthesis protein CbiB [Deinococcus maricopensis DSM 21211]|uniref:Cobalamin biosynthesis protein CobD n=2 Tax=Deinococcus TaxID=1298 RepID=E8U9J9_DEIML|nr:cobalamin biosynthesis protein CbiB [Deinococcus maricopensis DSM 21211]
MVGARDWAAGAAVAYAVGRALGGWHWLLDAPLLKTLLARKALFDAVGEVGAALRAGDLPAARRLTAWHLVSRDTAQLSAAEIAGAAIESLAENLSDSVVAPLLAYRAGGLPLAALYRYANTADAMWGYRTPELEHAGKVAARTDDLLNLAPARLTAVCALLATPLAGLSGAVAHRAWRRDARTTDSPNAGHPMSAFAGALGIRLTKRGQYALNAGGRDPEPGDVDRALRLARWTLALAVPALLIGGRRA